MDKLWIRRETLTSMADAVRSVTGQTGELTIEDMEAAYTEISANSGIDTDTDNPAAASDIAQDKVAWANGNKITGSLSEATDGVKIYGTGEPTLLSEPGVTEFSLGAVYSPSNIGNNTLGCILRPGAILAPRNVPTSLFGDADTTDVVARKTFTSSAGLKVTGELPEKKSGETIYLQNGTLDIVTVGGEESDIRAKGEVQSDTLIRSGSFAGISFQASEFGDATRDDVLSGKTFTSKNGIKVTGRATFSSGGSASSILSTTVTPTANSLTISFTGLEGEPSMFSIYPVENITLASTYYVVSVDYDGTTTSGVCGYTSGSMYNKTATNAYSAANYTWSYSNSTLTITSSSPTTGGYFASGIDYKLDYVTDAVVGSSGSGSSSESVEQATPSISIDSSGLITASSTQEAGYVAAGTKSATMQLTTQGVDTITPSTTDQTAVAAGVFTTGAITIKGDANLVSGNIKSGVSIFDVLGSYDGGGSGGFSGTPTAGDTPVYSNLITVTVSDATTAQDTGISYTVSKAGTYRFKVFAHPSSTYSYGSGNANVYFYKNGSEAATHAISTSSDVYSSDITCAVGDVISVYAMAFKQNYTTINAKISGMLVCVDWDNGF